MLKLLVIFHITGPTIFFYCIAYLIRNPSDWTGPAVIGPISLAFSIFAQVITEKKLKKITDSYWRISLRTCQIVCPLGGLAIGIMIYFII